MTSVENKKGQNLFRKRFYISMKLFKETIGEGGKSVTYPLEIDEQLTQCVLEIDYIHVAVNIMCQQEALIVNTSIESSF